eukprot:gene4952-9900_t
MVNVHGLITIIQFHEISGNESQSNRSELVRPIEPFMVEKLNIKGDAVAEYARLQSFFSVVQTIGSLIFGVMIDRFGSKGGFIISFVASALSYGLVANATTLSILYLSKVPTIFQAGFLCAQVAASQATADGPDRVIALGRLTFAYTIGSVIGPAIGGWIGASGDYYLGAKLAVGGSLLSVLLTLLMPNKADSPFESTKASKDIDSPIEIKKESVYEVIRSVWLILFTKLVTGIASSMSTTTFPLILKNIYNLNESSSGMSLSIIQLFNAIATGFLMGPITNLLGGSPLVVATYCLYGMTALFTLSSTIEATTSIILTSTHRFCIFFILCIFLSVMQYVLGTTLTGESTARVGPQSKGILIGTEHSLFAAARIASPQMGVYLLQYGGIPAVAGASGAVFFSVSILWNYFNKKSKKRHISVSKLVVIACLLPIVYEMNVNEMRT